MLSLLHSFCAMTATRGLPQVFLTPSHLAIVMEYAAGGELFNFLAERRFLTENEARFFFQQLICGLAHCHSEVRLCTWDAT